MGYVYDAPLRLQFANHRNDATKPAQRAALYVIDAVRIVEMYERYPGWLACLCD